MSEILVDSNRATPKIPTTFLSLAEGVYKLLNEFAVPPERSTLQTSFESPKSLGKASLTIASSSLATTLLSNAVLSTSLSILSITDFNPGSSNCKPETEPKLAIKYLKDASIYSYV